MEKIIESKIDEPTLIRIPKDNRNYILIGSIGNFMFLPLVDAPENVIDEWENFFEEVHQFKVENKCLETDIVIERDGLIGNYLVSKFSSLIADLDDYINYHDIVNAMNIAIFESNPIFEKLIVLFKNQASGNLKDLEQKYGVEVVKYIQANNDFGFYIDNINGEYEPKEYLVYENGVLSKKTIVEVQKQKSCR